MLFIKQSTTLRPTSLTPTSEILPAWPGEVFGALKHYLRMVLYGKLVMVNQLTFGLITDYQEKEEGL